MGIDNGGTVSKAVIFDLSGKEIARASEYSETITPQSGYNERDMERLWHYNCNCISTAIGKAGIKADDIVAVSVCGHGKGLYPWGKNDKPAYHGIMSTDNRAWKYPQKWKKDGTFERIYPKICQQLISCQQVSILAWIKDNAKDVYDNIKWIFSVKDYIRYRLTGEAYCEATDISGSGLMNVRDVCYDMGILESLGIPEVYDKLPPMCYSDTLCGRITKEASCLTGLAEGTPVAGGMFDIDAGAIAMDINNPEQLCIITGTWSINEFISEYPITNTEIAMNSLYAVPGFYLLEECSATGAGNLEWFIQNYIVLSEIPEGKHIYDYVNELVENIQPSDGDVYYLPFLYGSNAHSLAKASFIGLTTYHNKGHMLRAIYEGVAFSHKMHIERLLSVRKPPKVIRMAGGVTNSPLWVQMFADILGYPIETIKGTKELGALGCAMSAAVAVGEFDNYQQAAQSMVSISKPIYPSEINHPIYEKKYNKYKKIVETMDNIWDLFTI